MTTFDCVTVHGLLLRMQQDCCCVMFAPMAISASGGHGLPCVGGGP